MRKGLSCAGRPQNAPDCVGKAVRSFFSALLSDTEAGAVLPVVVGFSGGVDSTALLHAIYEVGSEIGVQPVAAHLNHGLRGRDSDEDEAHCREFCERLGIPFRSRYVDIALMASQSGLNLEDAGRRGRYALYGEVAEEFGAKYAALAHHADDQAETVLMRIIRGTGTRGMGAMPGIRRSGNISIIRPLITVRKADVAAYVKEKGLLYREDASNLDTGYLRNKVRHELLPLLERSYSSGIVDVLCRTAELAREESAALDEMGSTLLRAALKSGQQGHRAVLDLERLRGAAPAVTARALRAAYSFVRGTASDLYAANQADLSGLVSSKGRAKQIYLPGGITAGRSGGELTIRGIDEIREAVSIRSSSLTVPGIADTPLMRIRAASTDIPDDLAGKRRFSHSDLALIACRALGQDFADAAGAGRTYAVFDLEAAGDISVRGWEPGDSIIPFGMRGRKKLQDIFTDEKVPKDRRRLWPVLVLSDGTIAWVPGLRQAAAAKLGAETKAALVVAAEHKPQSL